MEKKFNITHVKFWIFAFLLFFLWIPLLQQKFRFFEEKPLFGAIVKEVKPTVSLKGILDDSYQKSFEKYYNQNFGFRNDLVRMNNQIHYSFFNSLKAKGVVFGKNGYLYEEAYIKAYLGLDFVGKDSIKHELFKLKKIQDTLQKLDKQILIVFAPGKGSFFPEYIPDNYPKKPIGSSNLNEYLDQCQAKGINYLNFNGWFCAMKATSKYPLYSKGGIHWSEYGTYLAMDSLVKYIGSSSHSPMPVLALEGIVTNQKISNDDNDIGNGLNLLYDNPNYTMAYPKLTVTRSPKLKYPKVLFVADSYYWGMFGRGYGTTLFGGGKFFYYNQEIYPDSHVKNVLVKDINLVQEVEKHDVVILMSTDANLAKFPYGFVDQLYEKYFPRKR
jgi:hypothetical protein